MFASIHIALGRGMSMLFYSQIVVMSVLVELAFISWATLEAPGDAGKGKNTKRGDHELHEALAVMRARNFFQSCSSSQDQIKRVLPKRKLMMRMCFILS